MLAVTVDITDHKLARVKRNSTEPSIFSIYTGIPTDDHRTTEQSMDVGFSVDSFLNLIRIPNADSKEDDFCFKTNNVYKSAMDVMDVMVSQIVNYSLVK